MLLRDALAWTSYVGACVIVMGSLGASAGPRHRREAGPKQTHRQNATKCRIHDCCSVCCYGAYMNIMPPGVPVYSVGADCGAASVAAHVRELQNVIRVCPFIVCKVELLALASP